MRMKLRGQLTLAISLVCLIIVLLISVLANISINIGFENYVKKQQKSRSQDIVKNLESQFNPATGEWEKGYIHGLGMYALYEGYVIKVFDTKDAVIWDAENHDMTLCHRIMDEISNRMEDVRPHLKGGIVAKEYNLKQSGQKIGRVVISSYGPYFFSENDFAFLKTFNAVLFVIGILSVSAAVIIGGVLAKRISSPISKTAHIATQISEGNYGIRFEGEVRLKELNELAGAMNNMAASLEAQDRIRKRLATDVAHELRTPLTAIASHLEAMIEGVWQPTAERLKSCYEEIGRISGLVADMEKLSQIEAENLILNKTEFDLLRLALAVKGNLEVESAKKDITVETKGEPCIITADRDRMSQVITNLFANAIKYTPEKGHISITLKNAPDNAVITVTDNGIGIPEDQLPFIFERFYRVEKSRSRSTGGAGIGLSIVKSIVLAHGGKIEVESRVGQGSSFRVILPKKS